MRTRDRHIIQSPQRGGKPCEPWSKEETEPCNTQSCQKEACIDGQWDDWQGWEPCSKTCEGGVAWCSRVILAEVKQCGKPVSGASRVHASCNDGVRCEPDVDCAFSSWSAWGDCSKSCDGIMRRSRGIAVQPRGRGLACTGDLRQTAPCLPTEGAPRPEGCLLEMPTDCTLGQWEAWTACSSCGGGQRSRSREVLMEARNGGRCPGTMLSETVDILPHTCPDCRAGSSTPPWPFGRTGDEAENLRYPHGTRRQ